MSDVAPGSNGRADEAAPSVSDSLLQRLREGDAEAWQRLTRLYGPTVYGWCRGARLSPEDAADLGQQVFTAVSCSLRKFQRNGPGDSFRGWLYTITRNKIRDHLDRDRRQPQAAGGTTAQQQLLGVPEPESGDSAPAQASSEKRDLCRRALELMQVEFAERTWRAFLEVAVQGRPPADVAAELGMSLGAVYIAKSRVRQRLREELGDLFSQEGVP
jgi:RNA polymerase sigma-70 factor (ECF subfamily)